MANLAQGGRNSAQPDRSKLRVLYLTEAPPYPLTSGHLRHFHLLGHLSRRHQVTLMSLCDEALTEKARSALEGVAEQVRAFQTAPRRGFRLSALGNRLRWALGRDPALTAMKRAIEQTAATVSFDAVITGKRTLKALPARVGSALIADVCDAASVRIRRHLRYAGARLPLEALRYALVRRAEQRLMGQADHILFISPRDRRDLVEDGAGLSCSVIPNGVDLDYWKRASPRLGGNTVIFTGVMSYPPNVDAALHLAHDILPLVRSSFPSAQLLIAGRNPTPSLLEVAAWPGVEVTGFVPDMRPFLERASVFAAPLRFGSGMQNKLLEALAMEVPVVASPLAAAGLATEDGETPPLATAEEPEEFASHLVARLEAAQRGEAPEEAGRRFVAEHYTWERSGERLAEIVEKVVGG